ncbi:MAG: segregation/condensation protein A [Candidatus Jorgensenbacteria bacterium]
MYELSLEKYRGPLDKLLELVLEKKLEISEVSLAEVTADFLGYLGKLEEERVNPTVITDFLVVASKLVLIKSKNLLPSLDLNQEEEEDIRLFEVRLKIYAEFKNAQKLIKENWNDYPRMAAREFLSTTSASFYPPQKVAGKDLYSALAKIVGDFEKIMMPVKRIKIEIINLKEKIEEVFRKLTSNPVGLESLKKGGGKSELVVIFLAILHLIKSQLVHVEQTSNFGDIRIARKS